MEFRRLKNVVGMAPVFLNAPHRIAALDLVFVLPPLVRHYLQVELRNQLADTGKTVR